MLTVPERNNAVKWLFVPLIFILVLNLVWAFSLELYADEAYYTLFSKHLDWGYFDHPPMVAWLIKFGTFILHGELGVRVPFVLLTTCSYGLLYGLVKPKRPLFYWMVVLGLFPLQLLGFMALPDMPLFFFCLLFFIQYRRFTAKPDVLNSVLLSLVIAALLYSKYHAALIIVFTLLSNPSLFKTRSFYLVTLMSFIIYFPHLKWLYDHDFVTIHYHLFEREGTGFSINNLLNYLLAFLLFNGPLLFAPLFFASFLERLRDLYENALFFNLKGFLLFFLFMAFRGRVEANWLFPVLIPAIVLGYHYLPHTRYFRVLAGFALLIIATFRLLLLFPVGEGNRLYEFHGHKEFAMEVKSQSEGLPIVANRYQEASLLSFYLDEFIPAMNVNSRRNQFDIWRGQGINRNEEVMFLQRNPKGNLYHPFFGRYTLEQRIMKNLIQSSSSTSRMSITAP